MQRKRMIIIAISAGCGAVIGGLATVIRGHLPSVAFFAPDKPFLEHRIFLFAAALCWVVFSLYWEYAATNAAAAKKSESDWSRAVHVTLTNLALVLAMAPIRGFGRFLPVSVAIMSVGLAIEAAGVAVAIWARRHLGRNWSGRISITVDHELVRSGPYRWLRHPIYTGLLLMYLGVALVTGEKLALVGLAMGVFAYWRKIRLEEANLDLAFGAGYQAYRRETWALVPGIY